MKAVLLLAALAGLAAAGTFVHKEIDFKVGPDYVDRQKKVFSLFMNINQIDYESEYYKFAQEWNIEANFDKYTNPKAVEEFWTLYLKDGFMPKGWIFSVFHEEMREDAIALFHLFYYAKDFETFYKTACWARVNMNEGMFVYAFNVAILHRTDTRDIVLPAPYEVYPYFFINAEDVSRINVVKMQGGIFNKERAANYGVHFNDNTYTIYSNFSKFHNHINREQYKLAYFTEDLALNTYYYYFHTDYPFWMGGEEFGLYKERRGEYYFYFHQQLLARYYLERLTNGLGEIPKFSWRQPIKTGYYPTGYYNGAYPANQRPNYYSLMYPENVEYLQFVEDFETQFRELIDQGFFKGPGDFKVDLSNNFDWLGNYWQYNPDAFHGKYPRHYNKYYEIIARVLLGLNREPVDGYMVGHAALEQFETALRDPMFYQLYSRIIYYFLQYKQQHLQAYTAEELKFDQVKVEHVKIDKLVTFFDTFDFDASNAAYWSQEEFKKFPYNFEVRTPRLNNKPFNVEVEVTSESEVEGVVKFFIGPKYDGFGYDFEYNWHENRFNFFEIDAFVYKFSAGKNTIVRNSKDFFLFNGDYVSAYEYSKKISAEHIPKDMIFNYDAFPEHLMLPKGSKGGFPLQFFVIVYPFVSKDAPEFHTWHSFGTRSYPRYLDAKPFGYPFDRVISDAEFYQHNMFVQDVYVYHDGPEDVYHFDWHYHSNEVTKH